MQIAQLIENNVRIWLRFDTFIIILSLFDKNKPLINPNYELENT